MGILDKLFRQKSDSTDTVSFDFEQFIYDDKSEFFQSNKDIFFEGNKGSYRIYSVHRHISLDYPDRKDIEYGNKSTPRKNLSCEEGYNNGKKIYNKKYGSINGSNLFEVFNNLDSLRMKYYLGTLEYLTLENYDEYYSKFNHLPEQYKLLSICFDRVIDLGCKYWEYDLWWNDMRKLWRIKYDINDQGVTDEEIRRFYVEYEGEMNLLTNNRNYPEDEKILSSISKGGELRCYNEHSRIRDDIIEYCEELRSNYYNEEEHTWKDFDIVKEFQYVMNRMLSTITDMDPDIWRISRSYPFFRIYRVIRDYMLYKKSFIILKEVFECIKKWEDGRLLNNDHNGFSHQKPMWIKWNIIWKDFFNSGKYLLFEDDGLDWLKEQVGSYLKEKQKFYNRFSGPKSEYHISDNTIYKFFNGFEIFTVQWKSEFELTLLVKQYMEKYNVEVKHHLRPHWLTPQELDIYFEIDNKKIGIEYQGEQHYKPIEYFGGEEGLQETKKRDKKKKRLCKKNDVILIYYNYDEEITYDILKKKLDKHGVLI